MASALGILHAQTNCPTVASRAVNIGGSTGRDYFRPRSAGHEAKDITVEDCTIIGSMAPIAFVGVDGAEVRYNTIYRPARWVARILQETQGAEFVACRHGQFTNNLIAFRSDELRTVVNVGAGTLPQTFTFAKNHWYCLDNPQRSSPLSLPVKEAHGRYGQNPLFADEKGKDLRLMKTSPVRDAGVRAKTDKVGQRSQLRDREGPHSPGETATRAQRSLLGAEVRLRFGQVVRHVYAFCQCRADCYGDFLRAWRLSRSMTWNL